MVDPVSVTTRYQQGYEQHFHVKPPANGALASHRGACAPARARCGRIELAAPVRSGLAPAFVG
jgi:hypothetical protein